MDGEAARALRIVLLTGPFPAHEAFIRYVARRVPVVGAIQETSALPQRSLPRRAAELVSDHFTHPRRLARVLAERWRNRRMHRQVLAHAEEAPAPEVQRFRVTSLNTPDGLERLRSLQPDLLVVAGTGLLRREVFAMAPRGAVNLHLGLSPRYRGSHCVFWSLYNEEPEWIGITVHYVDEGIDSGPILAQARPVVAAGDTLDTLDAKCLLLGYETMARALNDLRLAPRAGTVQNLADGRVYYARERTAEKTADLTMRMKDGLLARKLREHGGRLPEVPLVR